MRNTLLTSGIREYTDLRTPRQRINNCRSLLKRALNVLLMWESHFERSIQGPLYQTHITLAHSSILSRNFSLLAVVTSLAEPRLHVGRRRFCFLACRLVSLG